MSLDKNKLIPSIIADPIHSDTKSCWQDSFGQMVHEL